MAQFGSCSSFLRSLSTDFTTQFSTIKTRKSYIDAAQIVGVALGGFVDANCSLPAKNGCNAMLESSITSAVRGPHGNRLTTSSVTMDACAAASWNSESQETVCFFRQKSFASVKFRPMHYHGRVRQAWDCGMLCVSGPCLDVCIDACLAWCSCIGGNLLRYHALLRLRPIQT